ncbi:MAG: hypothetical protein FVQ85_20180 [Planctomycetes bacterium]|nr:hypothetical protein [Planctomycetota bacterium]
MKEKEFIEELRKTAKTLEPFVQSYNAGSLRWNGSDYVEATKTKKPNPYALAWWSKLRTIADLLETQESKITERQKGYIRHELSGGMGSLADLWLDLGKEGTSSDETSKQLEEARQKLSELLNG